ncbi:hypothetical protein CLV59_107112 [Chitinophaga dinghuensis]|uniref:Carboxypeptidase regulatory-like domain-containing protein n=1 Tax=Chitinophaga dinghuensis TaxID=1539050 RepID=A0A327VPT1_9BACT|nr:hypothetical protein [Chitinophaga dinghuensis]RAJ77345.1 hypothetical protein CLV59_107112 [Chitinophaga dinghuensis]
MVSKFVQLFSLIALITLFALQVHAQDKYGKVTYNKKNISELITGRNPEFGITGRDGCVVSGKLYLELRDMDVQHIEGWVRDEHTGQGLSGASVQLTRKNGPIEKLVTDSTGKFILLKAAPMKEMKVLYIGFWPLQIKGSKEKLF